MAIFRQFLYTSTGTEIEFVKGFTDLVLSLDDSFTIEDTSGNEATIENIYAQSLGAFVINLGNNQTIKFTRRNGATASGQSFNIALNNAGNYSLRYAFTNYSISAEAARTFSVAYIKGDNFLMFWLGSDNHPNISNAVFSFAVLKNNDTRFVGVSTTLLLTYALYSSDMAVTFSPLFQYAVEAGKIDYVDHAPFISGDTKQFDTDEIFTCSTVSQFASITLPGRGNYFAISPNALVPIDE